MAGIVLDLEERGTACALRELWIPYRPITLNHFIMSQNLLALFSRLQQSYVFCDVASGQLGISFLRNVEPWAEIRMRAGKKVKIPVKALD